MGFLIKSVSFRLEGLLRVSSSEYCIVVIQFKVYNIRVSELTVIC
jgi:hypothetical protein